MTYDAVISTSIGHLGLTIQENQLVSIAFLPADFSVFRPSHPATDAIILQLRRYFSDPTAPFSFPWRVQGTPFQQRVWQKLTNIPPGKTLTYGELARALNSAPRAVGQACRKNPLPIIIPCHRVVAQQGLGGYAGQTQGDLLFRKQWLLRHEGVLDALPC